MDDDDLSLERAAFDTERAEFDLLRAAALLPRVEGRTPDVEAVVFQVERWAAEVKEDAARRTSRQGPLEAIMNVLFAGAQLRGDNEEYDAPRNSFLEDVIVRRRGLPISLSLLVTETARRAGFVACGLALPRHFMAGLMLESHGAATDDAGGDLFFIDAFHATVLTLDAVAQRASVSVPELGEHLGPASPEAVLVRMLTNLRASYLRRQEPVPCLRVISRLLLLRPREAALHLERAHLLFGLGDAPTALSAAETGLKLARDPDEREAAEKVFERMTANVGWIQ